MQWEYLRNYLEKSIIEFNYIHNLLVPYLALTGEYQLTIGIILKSSLKTIHNILRAQCLK